MNRRHSPKPVLRAARSLLTATLMVATSCLGGGDRKAPVEPETTLQVPLSLISDGAHSDGTPGFFFLPPMVSSPGATGTFDGDIAAVNPVIAICDITFAPDVNCGASTPGATTAILEFTPTTNPPITVDGDKYKVNWDTGDDGFVAGHLYRVHVFVGLSRRELGFTDVLLTTKPGYAKNTDNQIIVLNDGRTLPIHFRIEQGVVPRVGPARAFELTGLPASLLSGAMASVTVTARDENGNVATGYRGTVVFTSSIPGAGATLPSEYTFKESDAGTHTFTNAIAFTPVGAATLRVTDAADVNIFGEASLTVVPLDAVRLEVTGLSDPTEAGTASAISVTARDANGNIATGYTGTIAFTSNLPQAALPGSYTFTAADAGTHAFPSVTLRTAGSTTVTATDVATSTITGAQTVTVTPAAAARLVLAGIPDQANAGTAYDLTVTAQDQFGNTATGYVGTVQFSSTDPAATVPTEYTFQSADAGVRSFPSGVTLRTAGARTVRGTDAADANIFGELAVTVLPEAAVSLQVSGLTDPVVAGTLSGITVTARDANGNVATGYTGTIAFTSSDPQATLPANYTFTAADAGTHAFPASVTLRTAGTATVRATDAADANIFGESSVTVLPAAAVSLQVSGLTDPVEAGTLSGITVTARDAFGNVATGYAGSIAFTSSDPQATLPENYTFTAADAGTHAFPASVTLRTAGSVTVTATDQAVNTITGTQTVSVTPAAAVRLLLSGIPALATAGVAYDLIVTAQDQFGNTATGYGGTVQFTSSDAAATLPPAYAFQPGDAGVRSFAGGVTFRTAGPQTLQATDAAVPAIAGNIAITVAPGAASQLRFTTQPSNALTENVIAPPVVVTAYDAFGNQASTFTGPIKVMTFSATLFGDSEVAAAQGVATFVDLMFFDPGSGYTLVASAPGLPGLTGATSDPFDITAPAPVEVHWINSAGGNWSVGSNWSTGSVPAADQTALIDLAGTYAVTLDVNASVKSFTLGAASGIQSLTANTRTLTVVTSGNVLSTGRMTLTNSTVNGSGTLAIASGGVITLSLANTINTAVVNAGTLQLGVGTFSSSSSITGAFTTVAGSLVRVQAGVSNSSTLTVTNGFTNHGTIELTKVSDATGAAFLVVNSGTLVNAPDGTISIVAGSGGGRVLTAQLDNQGTVNVLHPLTINRGSAQHTNSGTIAVSGGNLTLSQTGTTPSFTNAGTVTVATGRSWAITGGSFTQATGATLDGGGAMSLASVNPAVFGTAFTLSALTLNSSTANFATDITTQAMALSLNTSTINGSGTLTNAAGRVITLQVANTINMAVVNAGTLQLGVGSFSSSSSITGAFTTVAGSLVRVQAGVSNSSTLTVANGFTNHGTIELTKAVDAVGASFLVVSNGTLVNAPDGTISIVAGSGGGRVLTAQLDNQGTVNVLHPLTINRGSAQHTNSGTIGVTGGNLTLNQSGTTPSFTNTGTVTVAAGRVWAINTGTFTQGSDATLNGGGAMTMQTVNPAVFGSAFTLASLTLSSSTIASFAEDITTETAGTLTVANSTVNGPGTVTNSAGRVLTISGTISGGTINAPLVNAGTVVVNHASAVNGGLTTVAGSMLRVQGLGFPGGVLTVGSGFTNKGTIELTSTGLANSAILSVNGTLVNDAGATISVLLGTGGARILTAQLDNRGTLNVGHHLTINRASADHTNSGTIAVTGGNLTVTQSGTTPSFTNSAGGVINVATTRVMSIGNGAVTNALDASIQGAGTFETGTTASFNNAGNVTITLMRIGDGLTSTGTFAPVTAEFFGSPATIPVGAGYSYTNVSVVGAASFAGSVSMTGNLTVSANGSLTVGAHEISVAGNFATQHFSRLTMQNAAGVLAVTGSATFGGGGSNTWLTAGTLRVAGNFAQSGNVAAFAASGAHLTVLNGAGAQSVSFVNPGTTGATSHFHRLEMANASAAGVTLGSAAFATGQLRTPAGSSVARTLSSAGQTLQTGGLDAVGLVLNGTPLRVVNGEALTRFDDGVFTNMDPAATQFRLDRLSDVVTFNNIQFQTAPTTGFYMHLVDTNLAAPLFTVTMQGTQPANHGGRVTESVAGQLLGWPF